MRIEMELWETQPEWEISIERKRKGETQLLIISSGQLYSFNSAINAYIENDDYSVPFVYEINGFEINIDIADDVKIHARSISSI
jgi:hypothetical protein